jgi:hypothetical protein
MIVIYAGWNAVDAAASGEARDGRAGFSPVSDQRHADERRQSVRQNRVVLTPQRLASSLAEARKARPGRRASFRKATVSNKPDHRGELDISRQAIAQGRPECLR